MKFFDLVRGIKAVLPTEYVCETEPYHLLNVYKDARETRGVRLRLVGFKRPSSNQTAVALGTIIQDLLG